MKTNRYLFYLALLLFVSHRAGLAEPAPMATNFAAALRSGDAGTIRELLDKGASANARDALGNTPLIQAASYANTTLMRLLLEHGADVNATNQAGATALIRGASDVDKVALLLDHGASVNSQSALGNSALMLAARPADSHRAVELLLSRGADVNATNRFGATALMAAVAGGDLQTVRTLVEHGAMVNAQPGADHVSFILGGGRSALMWAAYRGDLAALKILLDAGADVNGAGALGTPLAQAAWNNQTEAAQLLIERGAKVNEIGRPEGYTALHWAASTEEPDASLVKLLLKHGADPNIGGGENVDAFMGTPQTPLMLARRRGNTPIVAALTEGGATAATPDRFPTLKPAARAGIESVDEVAIRAAIDQALPPLHQTSIESKQAFVRHASHQDCTSCHQQFLPMAAIGLARKQHAAVNEAAEKELIRMVSQGELKNPEVDWEPLFHPDPVNTKGYAILACTAEDLQPDGNIDSWVNHLLAIQGKDGQWYNNLPRPPIQTSDIGATALAINALQRYPLPGRQEEISMRVDRARRWLSSVKPLHTEGRVYQILGLAWAGEPTAKIQELAKALASEQHPDGGWSQLSSMASDAYATGQAIYALRMGAGMEKSNPSIHRGLRFLLANQLEDGTWYVHRRTFPFQPTMQSGFPHGRDSWISAAASSWAVMALSVPESKSVALSSPGGTVVSETNP